MYRSYYLRFINYARFEYSIGFQIANMQELRYNIELEQEAKTFLTCDDVKHGSNYRVLLIQSVFNSSFITDPDARLIKKNEKKLMEDPIFKRNTEFLHPLQSELACVELLEKCPIDGEKETASEVCLFGPKVSNPISKWKHGKPTSQCPNGKADSGLCKRDNY